MKPNIFIPIYLIKKEALNDKALLNKKILEEKNRVCYIERQLFSTTNGEEAKNRSNEKNIL
jgi:hypothetical protein